MKISRHGQAEDDLQRDRGPRATLELGARDAGEDDQRRGIGEDRRADRGCHAAVGREARGAGGGIEQQRVGGEKRPQQQRRGQRSSRERARSRCRSHRQQEGDDPEADDGAAVDPDQGEVELDPGDEHQVEQPKLPEVGDRRVAGADQVEPVGADREAAEQQPDDAGDRGRAASAAGRR